MYIENVVHTPHSCRWPSTTMWAKIQQVRRANSIRHFVATQITATITMTDNSSYCAAIIAIN